MTQDPKRNPPADFLNDGHETESIPECLLCGSPGAYRATIYHARPVDLERYRASTQVGTGDTTNPTALWTASDFDKPRAEQAGVCTNCTKKIEGRPGVYIGVFAIAWVLAMVASGIAAAIGAYGTEPQSSLPSILKGAAIVLGLAPILFLVSDLRSYGKSGSRPAFEMHVRNGALFRRLSQLDYAGAGSFAAALQTDTGRVFMAKGLFNRLFGEPRSDNAMAKGPVEPAVAPLAPPPASRADDGMCFYCGSAPPAGSVTVVLTKSLSSTTHESRVAGGSVVSTTAEVARKQLEIPRCAACQGAHEVWQVDALAIGVPLLATCVFFVVWGVVLFQGSNWTIPLTLGVGGSLGWAGHKYRRRFFETRNSRPKDDVEGHPTVAAHLADGWSAKVDRPLQQRN